jgi:hypothetical protein
VTLRAWQLLSLSQITAISGDLRERPEHLARQGDETGGAAATRRYRNCGRFLERQVRRLQRHDVRRHRNVFGKAAVAVVQEIGVDLVAGLEPGNAAAGRLHLPGNVDAEDLMFRPQQSQGGARTGACRAWNASPLH